jgi:methylated-DNA-protein-cysteine methyltransferase-like protein
MKTSTTGRSAENASRDGREASAAQRREAFYLCLSSIPHGKVVSYGELAAIAGLGRAARWVARMLAQLPEGSSLPWHRVITASGRPGLSAECPTGVEQRQRLREEGIILTNDRVDMRRHGWHPTPLNR